MRTKFAPQIAELLNRGWAPKEIAEHLHCSHDYVRGVKSRLKFRTIRTVKEQTEVSAHAEPAVKQPSPQANDLFLKLLAEEAARCRAI